MLREFLGVSGGASVVFAVRISRWKSPPCSPTKNGRKWLSLRLAGGHLNCRILKASFPTKVTKAQILAGCHRETKTATFATVVLTLSALQAEL